MGTRELAMITFEQVSYLEKVASGPGRPVLTSVNLVIPASRRIALMGDPFEHTRLVIGMISGGAAPSSGRVRRMARVSFPAGEIRMFIPEISVRGNVQHIARLYGADARAVVRFAQDVMAIGADFEKPFGSLTVDVRKSLSHIIAYSIPFQIYVLNHTLKRGGNRLNESARELLRIRTQASGLIAPTRDIAFAKEFCDTAMVLRHTKLHPFDDIDAAAKASKRSDWTPVEPAATVPSGA